MLDHLLNFDFEPVVMQGHEALALGVPLAKAAPDSVIDAQQNTADWLNSIGAPTEDQTQAQTAATLAQEAFKTVVSMEGTSEDQKARLIALKTPAAVRHLTGMLTAYDWEFVQQAKELRGYAVSKIVEETSHPDARIRLRALELLGRVTEVALFTDRVEVKKTNVDDRELDAKIKEKLARFVDVVDVEPQDAVLLPSEALKA